MTTPIEAKVAVNLRVESNANVECTFVGNEAHVLLNDGAVKLTFTEIALEKLINAGEDAFGHMLAKL